MTDEETRKQVIESLKIEDIPQSIKDQIEAEVVKKLGQALVDLSTARNDLTTQIETVLKNSKKDSLILNATSLGEETRKLLIKHKLLES